MPICKKIPTFWWFEEGRVGGMGKPGFNRTHWMDFPLEQAMLFNWFGQHLYYRPDLSLQKLWDYLDDLGPKVAQFTPYTEQQVMERFAALREPEVLLLAIDQMNQRAEILDGEVRLEPSDATGGERLRFGFCGARMEVELAALEEQGISVLISLLEDAPQVPETGLELHHFSIPDLSPPTLEQIQAFATLLWEKRHACVAVHCFAGVGRTSTMLVAARLLQGQPFAALTQRLQSQNPHYQLKGRQWRYLCELNASIEAGKIPLLDLK